MAELKNLDQWQLIVCAKEAYNQVRTVAVKPPPPELKAADLLNHLSEIRFALGYAWPYAEALVQLDAELQKQTDAEAAQPEQDNRPPPTPDPGDGEQHHQTPPPKKRSNKK